MGGMKILSNLGPKATGGADYILTYDGHFNIVKELPFPKIGVFTPDEFLSLLANES